MPALLHRGAEADSFRGQVWSCGAIAAVIHLEFSISYHPVHVGRWLNALRWSPPQPVRRDRPRNDAAIPRGWEETWPALKRGHQPRD